MKLLFLFISACLLPGPAVCSWENTVTAYKPGPFLKTLRPVHLSFEINWDGKINSGTLNFLIGRKDKRYPDYHIVQIYGNSTGLARGLYPYDYSFTSFLKKTDFQPAMLTAVEKDRNHLRETSNWYRSTTTSREVTTPHRKGKTPRTKKTTFAFKNGPVHDLASALLYVRSLNLKVGQETVMVPVRNWKRGRRTV